MAAPSQHHSPSSLQQSLLLLLQLWMLMLWQLLALRLMTSLPALVVEGEVPWDATQAVLDSTPAG